MCLGAMASLLSIVEHEDLQEIDMGGTPIFIKLYVTDMSYLRVGWKGKECSLYT